ncbi:MAG: DMT family transporter [Pseudomonadota bacterium]
MRAADAPRDNLRGGAWLIADLLLNICSLSIVKWLGAEYPAAQIVFLRALAGLLLILPWIWRARRMFRQVPDLGLHALRIALSVVTLTASFYAISRVPLALFTAIGFTRPVMTMIMAAWLLRETIGSKRWLAAGIALLGVVIAVDPGAAPLSSGLLALGVVVLTGSGAVIATRRLRAAPSIVLMAFYTGGLALLSAPFALAHWVPVPGSHLLPLCVMGVLAQVAQLCFLRAHFYGEAGFLSVLSYLSLILSVFVGYVAFDEIPGVSFAVGAVLVVGAALWVNLAALERRPRGGRARPKP